MHHPGCTTGRLAAVARWRRARVLAWGALLLAGLPLGLGPLLAVATPLAAPCDPRPPINVTVVNSGEHQLRITVTVTTNASTPTNQLVSILLNSGSSGLTDIPWERSGSQPPIYHPAPGTQSYSFLLTLDPSASAATPALTFVDVCGPWPWFGGGGPSAFAPALSLAKTHTGSFTQGQTGAQYTLTVSNSGGATTSGLVTLTDALPSGLTPTAASGPGWTCPTPFTNNTVTCTRSDALAVGASYPPITLVVSVASTAPASVTNTASVTGGAAASGMVSDATTILQLPRITSAASTTFTVGQAGTFTVTASGSPPLTITR